MTVIISHPDCLLHNSEAQNTECPERLSVISKALSSANLEADLCYDIFISLNRKS